MSQSLKELLADQEKKKKANENPSSAGKGDITSNNDGKHKATHSNEGNSNATNNYGGSAGAGSGDGGDDGSGGGGRQSQMKTGDSKRSTDNSTNIYWSSSEAKLLFGFDEIDDDVDVVEGLKDRILLLQKVNEREDGYQLVIPMTEDSSDCVSNHNKFTIRNKSLFLIRAYQIALEKPRVGVRWIDDCCQPAVDELNNLGVKTTQSKKTIGKWNRDFRKHEKFPHPNVHVRMGKKPKPPIFELYPHLEATVGEFVIKHLDFFTVEMLRSELVTEMIPKLVKECEDAKEEDSLGYKVMQTYMDKEHQKGKGIHVSLQGIGIR